jgi:predicted permease
VIGNPMNSAQLVSNLRNDLRFAIRQLAKNPGFTFTAIAVLAAGMCAAVAIFAFVDAVLIKPLPFRDPARLAAVYETTQSFPRSNLSYQDFLDWRRRNTVFQSLEAYQARHFTLTSASSREFARVARVSAGFFRTLGVAPAFGRDFHDGEDKPSEPRTAIISYSLWQSKYGARRDVLGQSITIEDGVWTIVGVLPRAFQYAPIGLAEYWIPLRAVGGCELRRSCHNLYGVARLKDGVSVESANSSIAALAAQMRQELPATNSGQGGAVFSLTEVIVGDVRPVLTMLLSGAGLLLLIAAVNVAGLLAVRSESRSREISVRRAMGASRLRLLAQFIVEAAALVIAGGGLGLAAAVWLVPVLKSLIPAGDRMTFLEDLGINWRITAFALAVALLSAALFAAAPALRIGVRDLRAGLAEGGRGGSGAAWRRLGSKFVVLELAAAMVLLTGAGLLGKSLYNLLRVNLGLQPAHLVTLDVIPPGAAYAKSAQQIALAREVLSRIQALPGVTAAGYESDGEPLGGNGTTTWLRVVGRTAGGEHRDVAFRAVSPTYLSALGATLARGRYFTETDDASAPAVVIVNEAFARQSFPGEDPVGKQIAYVSNTKAPPMQIVGVVRDMREGPLDSEIPPFVYLPFSQQPDTQLSVVVRTAQEPLTTLRDMNASIRQFDPDIVTAFGMTMEDRIDRTPSVYIHRLSAWLVGGFAAFALAVGVVGLYGVIAYSVSRRTREIGVRMALGAQPAAVYSLVMKEAGWLTALGIALGAAGSLAAAGVMRSLLFGVSSWDAATLAGVAAILASAAAAASFLPARRAASINPVEALRSE